jgi:hypothetical protein
MRLIERVADLVRSLGTPPANYTWVVSASTLRTGRFRCTETLRVETRKVP